MAIVLLSTLWRPAAAAAGEADARIVYINSYHRGYSWGDDIEQGLRDRLAAAGRKVEISVEYLDSRRFAYGDQLEPLAQSMALKYTAYRPDVVVVSDNAAFDFVTRNRQRLFPGLPIVFCGYNNFRHEVLQGNTNITGVNEEISIADTVEMALQVYPASRTLVFITSTGEESSRRISEIAEQTVFPVLRQRFDVVVLKDASVAEIAQRLQQLPHNSLLFLSGQSRDQGTGRALSPTESTAMITAVSPFPTYSFWDFALGKGVIGGHILRGVDQGRAAADLVLRILAGESVDDIPVVMNSPASDGFDYRVMQRFGIAEHDLPSGARIINQPSSLWRTYGPQFAGMVALLLLQTVLIIVLLRTMRGRHRALAALQEQRDLLEQRVLERTADLSASRKKFQALVNDIGDQFVIYSHTLDGELVYVSDGITAVVGFPREEVLGRK